MTASSAWKTRTWTIGGQLYLRLDGTLWYARLPYPDTPPCIVTIQSNEYPRTP